MNFTFQTKHWANLRLFSLHLNFEAFFQRCNCSYGPLRLLCMCTVILDMSATSLEEIVDLVIDNLINGGSLPWDKKDQVNIHTVSLFCDHYTCYRHEYYQNILKISRFQCFYYSLFQSFQCLPIFVESVLSVPRFPIVFLASPEF